MERVNTNSNSFIQESQQELHINRPSRRPKRQNNKNEEDKIYQCPCKCNRKYSTVGACKTHFKTCQNKPNNQQQWNQIWKQYTNKIKNQNQIKQIPNGRQIFINQIPTINQEAKHKYNSDKIFLEIANIWRQQPFGILPSFEEVKFDRYKDTVGGQLKSFDDLINRRKQLLNIKVRQLIDRYELHILQQNAGMDPQFRVYRIVDGNINGRKNLQFGWDILRYFKPQFGAKLKIILYSLCYNPQNLRYWRRFKEQQIQKYSFILPILNKYHQIFINYDATKMMFI